MGGKRIAVAAEGGSGGGADPMAFVHGPQRAALQDFVQALREGHEPAVSGRSALAVQRVIDAIGAPARSGQAVAPS